MSKIVKEDCHSISIYKLKEWGSLNQNYKKGSIIWTSQGGKENKVDYELNLDMQYFKLDYKVRFLSEEWTDVSHSYPLESQPCFYGGKRWFFRCSMYKNGHYCGRKVSKLYLCPSSNYFACRHCLELTYSSRVDGYSYTFWDLDKFEPTIKRWFYNGKMTRKATKYKKMQIAVLKDLSRLKLSV